MAPKGEMITYQGSCHCAAIKFSVDAPPITTASSCNCSICSKNGSLFIYPTTKDFVLEHGESLEEYRFGRKTLGHNVSHPDPAKQPCLPLAIQVNSRSKITVLLEVRLLGPRDEGKA